MSKQKYFTDAERNAANREKAARYYDRNKKKIRKARVERYKKQKGSLST